MIENRRWPKQIRWGFDVASTVIRYEVSRYVAIRIDEAGSFVVRPAMPHRPETPDDASRASNGLIKEIIASDPTHICSASPTLARLHREIRRCASETNKY